MKTFKQFLKERMEGSERKVYSSSHTSMLNVGSHFQSKSIRFIVDHQDKFRFGDAEHLIHWQIAVGDGNVDWQSLDGDYLDRMFTEHGKYAGYVDLVAKKFSIARIRDGSAYVSAGKLSGKIKTVVDYLESKGFHRGADSLWPR